MADVQRPAHRRRRRVDGVDLVARPRPIEARRCPRAPSARRIALRGLRGRAYRERAAESVCCMGRRQATREAARAIPNRYRVAPARATDAAVIRRRARAPRSRAISSRTTRVRNLLDQRRRQLAHHPLDDSADQRSGASRSAARSGGRGRRPARSTMADSSRAVERGVGGDHARRRALRLDRRRRRSSGARRQGRPEALLHVEQRVERVGESVVGRTRRRRFDVGPARGHAATRRRRPAALGDRRAGSTTGDRHGRGRRRHDAGAATAAPSAAAGRAGPDAPRRSADASRAACAAPPSTPRRGDRGSSIDVGLAGQQQHRPPWRRRHAPRSSLRQRVAVGGLPCATSASSIAGGRVVPVGHGRRAAGRERQPAAAAGRRRSSRRRAG